MGWLDQENENSLGSASATTRNETAYRAEGLVALQAENWGTDATDTRNQSGTNAEGTDGLLN